MEARIWKAGRKGARFGAVTLREVGTAPGKRRWSAWGLRGEGRQGSVDLGTRRKGPGGLAPTRSGDGPGRSLTRTCVSSTQLEGLRLKQVGPQPHQEAHAALHLADVVEEAAVARH